MCFHCKGKIEVVSGNVFATEENMLRNLLMRFGEYITTLERRKSVFLPFPSMEFECKGIDIQLENYRDMREELKKDLQLVDMISEYPGLSTVALKVIQQKILRFEKLKNADIETAYTVSVDMFHHQHKNYHVLTFVPREKKPFVVSYGGIGKKGGGNELNYKFDEQDLSPFPVFINHEFVANVDLANLPKYQLCYDTNSATWVKRNGHGPIGPVAVVDLRGFTGPPGLPI
jgi:hypothetical protein